MCSLWHLVRQRGNERLDIFWDVSMLGRLYQSARRALSPSLLATGALGASAYAAYQLDWLTVSFDCHVHHHIHAPVRPTKAAVVV